jgi:hypothetical protein
MEETRIHIVNVREHKVGKSAFIALTPLVVGLGGSLVALLGFGAGALLAFTIGFPWVGGYGGIPAEEGAASLAGMIISALAAASLLRYWLKEQRRVRLLALLLFWFLWICFAVAQHRWIVANVKYNAQYVFLPVVIVGVFLVPLLLFLGDWQRDNKGVGGWKNVEMHSSSKL